MSEILDNFKDLKYLPIFPLQIVLLPNELLPLHIFEPRYQQMLKDIKISDNFFGLSYFNPEKSLDIVPEIGSYGCVAQVREVDTTSDGRSNILTVGVIRYRLDEYVTDGEPYLVAKVTVFEDDADDDFVNTEIVGDEVFELFKRVAKAIHYLSGARENAPEIPKASPQMLSFLISAAFSLDPQMKYSLLKTRSTIERLRKLKVILKQAVDKLEMEAEINKLSKSNGHSKKDINLN